MCSILILDPGGTYLSHGAAPSLPKVYVQAIDGSAIGPNAGSCGTAAYLGKPVIVSDIAHDALWNDYRDLALPHGLRACWSTPITSGEGKVLGTFALYYHEPRRPTEREREVVRWATPFAAIVIEEKQISEALQEQHEELEMILDAAPAMILYKDRENTILRANRTAAEAAGLEKRDMQGRSAYDLSPQQAAQYHRDDLEVIRSGKAKLSIRETVVTWSGEERQIITDKIPFRDRDGNVLGVIVFARDVTEQHRAELALRETEMRYRSMVERAPYGILRIDASGRILTANRALVAMLGYASAEELVSAPANLSIYADPEEPAGFIRNVSNLESGVDVRCRRKNGSLITVRLAGGAVRDENGSLQFLDLIAENVTERRELEEQLLQSQKMEAVGRLAGGIAHDFNNFLTIILGHLDMLRRELGPQHPGQRRAEHLAAAVDKAASLTRRLLVFSCMQILQPRVINLNDVVTEFDKLLRSLAGENVDLSVELDPDLGHALADPGQIEQVILNLVVNARDAMATGGRLLIKTANIEVAEAWANLHRPTIAGSYVMLSVSDTGAGIDAKILPNIFKLFFTTKGQGKGTGLGLFVVDAIVKQSSGYIWVTSQLGQGTCFQVYLPRTRDSAVRVEVPGMAKGCPGGDETVLLIDDEDDVRQILGEMLEECGYKVLLAKNGAEAFEIADKYPDPIHLLLTDMVLPDLRGFEVAARFTQLRGGIGVVYFSGFGAFTDVQHREIGSAVLLQKPFTRDTLARAVREAIDRSKGKNGRAASV